ncbi:MAG: SUMF1/EgtB/PvdO family nonheme iron enzyme [Planctomycetes bacterium]|nr:SUMF1/EgtB/PvdO family nonheme iron enzyme [Planctomycetota bacterium]
MQDADLLYAVLAHQSGCATRAGVFSALADPGPMREALLARAAILPFQAVALTRLVEALTQAHGGDPAAALRSVPVDAEFLTEMRLGAGMSSEETVVMDSASAARPPAPGPAELSRGDRFQLGPELGRGGLGRVLEATDRDLGREVAVKLVLDDLPAHLSARFAREARLTARLDHPNIVPIYEFGEVAGADGRKRLFLAMKRVRGRDMGAVLRGLAFGGDAMRQVWSRARMLGAFQNVCQAVAYAHSKGVIHRDLKPANVMLGDYGETFVVDWGLAREKGEADEEPAAGPPRRVHDALTGSSRLTMAGQVLGTPAYMPPEQAAGNLKDLDEKSDIYSLGGILYEILALRPPYEGKTAPDVLAAVRAGRLDPPSKRAHPAAGPVPPELDAVVLHAMAVRPEDRHTSALDLARDVQRFLEGIAERERRAREAKERAAEGRRLLGRFRELGVEIAAQERKVKEMSAAVRSHEPVEAKRPVWREEAKREELSDARGDALGRAQVAFDAALSADAGSAEAAEGKSELHADLFLEAESRQDRQAMRLHRAALEAYDRNGVQRARLDAPGRLAFRAFAYACDCLKPSKAAGFGIDVAEAPGVPWRDGRPRPDLPLADSDWPVPALALRPAGTRWGHREDCAKRELRASVTVARYEAREKRLVPGAERLIGVTPMESIPLEQGSWRCVLRCPGFADAVVPVCIERAGEWRQDVTLYRPDEIPPGFVPVAGGPYQAGGAGTRGAEPGPQITEDLFAAKLPVTTGEYVAFLNDLAASGRLEEAAARQPREGATPHLRLADGRFGPAAADAAGALLVSPDLPVMGISWHDAVAYCAWRSAREGRVVRLLHEREWEKAARGTDGRRYPWGDEDDATFSNTNESQAGAPRIVPAGSFPADESPFGLRDMAGNMVTWCWNAPDVPYRDFCALRGGGWDHTRVHAECATRLGFSHAGTFRRYGMRVCVPVMPRA